MGSPTSVWGAGCSSLSTHTRRATRRSARPSRSTLCLQPTGYACVCSPDLAPDLRLTSRNPDTNQDRVWRCGRAASSRQGLGPARRVLHGRHGQDPPRRQPAAHRPAHPRRRASLQRGRGVCRGAVRPSCVLLASVGAGGPATPRGSTWSPPPARCPCSHTAFRLAHAGRRTREMNLMHLSSCWLTHRPKKGRSPSRRHLRKRVIAS